MVNGMVQSKDEGKGRKLMENDRDARGHLREEQNVIRIKDIAAKAGVSPTTVSNVIHGNKKKVSEKTVKRVNKILDELGYVPSVGALILAGTNSHVIGVLVGSGSGSVEQQAFTNIIIRALEQEINRRNYYMILHFADSAKESLQFAAVWKVEGMITIGLGEKENQKIQNRCLIPVVSIDTYYEEGRQVANVGLDDFGGGYLMGAYLLEKKNWKICFLADNDVGVDHQRWMGLKRACVEAGMLLTEKAHILIPAEPAARRRFYKANLAHLAFTSHVLFFASDYYAMEAIGYLQDLGIRVPEEISIVGFDDNDCAVLSRPRLTTIQQNVSAKAVAAVKMLFSFIYGEGPLVLEEKLPVRLVVRDSVTER